MSAGVLRAFGAVVGASTMLVAGMLTTGWWWCPALVGAAAAAGALVDRQLVHAHVLATLVAVVGLSAAGHAWFIAVLVAGTIGATELAAVADRSTTIRSAPPGLPSALAATAGAMVLSAAVLGAGAIEPAAAFLLVAALGATVATRVIAR